jgi:hypothetical protein
MSKWIVTKEIESEDCDIVEAVDNAAALADMYYHLGIAIVKIGDRRIIAIDEQDFKDWFGD